MSLLLLQAAGGSRPVTYSYTAQINARATVSASATKSVRYWKLNQGSELGSADATAVAVNCNTAKTFVTPVTDAILGAWAAGTWFIRLVAGTTTSANFIFNILLERVDANGVVQSSASTTAQIVGTNVQTLTVPLTWDPGIASPSDQLRLTLSKSGGTSSIGNVYIDGYKVDFLGETQRSMVLTPEAWNYWAVVNGQAGVVGSFVKPTLVYSGLVAAQSGVSAAVSRTFGFKHLSSFFIQADTAMRRTSDGAQGTFTLTPATSNWDVSQFFATVSDVAPSSVWGPGVYILNVVGQNSGTLVTQVKGRFILRRKDSLGNVQSTSDPSSEGLWINGTSPGAPSRRFLAVWWDPGTPQPGDVLQLEIQAARASGAGKLKFWIDGSPPVNALDNSRTEVYLPDPNFGAIVSAQSVVQSQVAAVFVPQTSIAATSTVSGSVQKAFSPQVLIAAQGSVPATLASQHSVVGVASGLSSPSSAVESQHSVAAATTCQSLSSSATASQHVAAGVTAAQSSASSVAASHHLVAGTTSGQSSSSSPLASLHVFAGVTAAQGSMPFGVSKEFVVSALVEGSSSVVGSVARSRTFDGAIDCVSGVAASYSYVPTGNFGHAEIQATEAEGSGYVVAEEIDGHAYVSVTAALGYGRLARQQPIGVRAPRPRWTPPRVLGDGFAEHPGFHALGSGGLFVEFGEGRASFEVLDARGNGHLEFEVYRGSGSSNAIGYVSRGFGFLQAPPRSLVLGAARATDAFLEPDEADRQSSATVLRRRRRVVAVPVVDEDEELLLLECLK